MVALLAILFTFFSVVFPDASYDPVWVIYDGRIRSGPVTWSFDRASGVKATLSSGTNCIIENEITTAEDGLSVTPYSTLTFVRAVANPARKVECKAQQPDSNCEGDEMTGATAEALVNALGKG